MDQEKIPLKIIFYTFCKNEIDFVDRWVETVNKADLVLVIDTGSTDGTYEKFLEKAATRPNFIITQRIYDFFRFDVAFNDARSLLEPFHNPTCRSIYVYLELDQTYTCENICSEIKKQYDLFSKAKGFPPLKIKLRRKEIYPSGAETSRDGKLYSFGNWEPSAQKFIVHEENYHIDNFSFPHFFELRPKDLNDDSILLINNATLLHTPSMDKNPSREAFYLKLLKIRYEESLDKEITTNPYDTFSALIYYIFFVLIEHQRIKTTSSEKIQESFFEIQKVINLKGAEYFKHYIAYLYLIQFYFIFCLLFNQHFTEYEKILKIAKFIYLKILDYKESFKDIRKFRTSFPLWEEPVFKFLPRENTDEIRDLQKLISNLSDNEKVKEFIPSFEDFGKKYLGF